MASRAPRVAVAGLSARLLAQSAERAGLDVVALDIFGDRDTRAHADMWLDIGGDGLSIDRTRLYDALECAARLPRMLGLIVTSGLEPLAMELSRAPRVPRFIGNGAQAQTVRDPRRFFALLNEAHVPHPEVRFTPPEDARGWLVKRSDGCGGTHIAWAEHVDHLHADAYFQRFSRGRSMSALFVAAHREATVIGFAEQLTVAAGNLPFVHAGSLGPIMLPRDIAERIVQAIETIVWKTDLTGLNSIDFLLDDDTFQVLEINTRPSSTMALYETAWPDAWPRGLIGAHVEACLDGDLPHTATWKHPPPMIAGQRVVFASHGFTVSTAFSDACFADSACHDVPSPGARIEAGMPVCTITATASTLDALRIELDRQRARLLQRINAN
ncbi:MULTISPECIES: ATP-grasp domain-containing protein [unclassified Caballeronia]|uniref:ATP-grasp domain-containing protein n=1 Tax=unclassified Caballeronia TaxID=2646786 RepID=UPI00285C4329|nr:MULTISPECIES: ATP-grasp domain-containing protein [unclassified Caballeronia]MDR5739954.1 ATP-grasp domain-containing protein [Caballeronia sp. LZ016]MDR5807346.1 ATP-grasp domain-containing protein [Caballeronia sp. LZ019]